MNKSDIYSVSCVCSELDEITFRLECAVDNLGAIHGAMEEDGGANPKIFCNAVFSAYLQLLSLKEELQQLSDAHYKKVTA